MKGFIFTFCNSKIVSQSNNSMITPQFLFLELIFGHNYIIFSLCFYMKFFKVVLKQGNAQVGKVCEVGRFALPG